VLVALSGQEGESLELKDPEQVKRFVEVVDRGSVWASQQVFTGCGGGNKITFDDLAGWYSREPNKTPWIELLDLRKWVVQSDN